MFVLIQVQRKICISSSLFAEATDQCCAEHQRCHAERQAGKEECIARFCKCLEQALPGRPCKHAADLFCAVAQDRVEFFIEATAPNSGQGSGEEGSGED